MKTNKLKNYLDGLDYLNEEQKNNVLINFARLVNSGLHDENTAFARIKWGIENISKARIEANASITYSLPQTQIGQTISDNLAEIAQTKISADPLERTRAAIRRFRANLQKISGATLTSAFCPHETSILSDEELSTVKNKWAEMDIARSNELTRWNSYARAHGLKD